VELLKICIFHKFSPPFSFSAPYGGAPRVSLELARGLSKMGNKVFLVNTADQTYFDKLNNVNFIGSAEGDFNTILPKSKPYTRHILNGLHNLPEKNLDILHSASEGKIFVFKSLLGVKTRLNVLHLHDEPVSVIKQKILNINITKQVLKNVDLYIAVSQFIAKKLVENFDIDKSCIAVIYNGVDLERFKLNQSLRRKNIILYAGALTPQKGPHILLESVKRVKESFPDVEVWIIGSSSFWLGNNKNYEEKLRLMAMQLGNVKFLGMVSEDKLPELYAMASICVIPSNFEDPSPLVAYEAQAAGLPLIASRVGGIPEIVEDGKTGLLVPRGDSESLADTICRLLENVNLRLKLGEAGEKRAKLFSWDIFVKNMFNAYEKHLS